MNAENFSEYLKNPSQLYQISYQELKSLVLQYPYSPNLRYLLMRKAKMDNSADYDHLLGIASAYSIDRSFLFKKMKADGLIPEFEENYELNEEYLELKDLAVLEQEPIVAENLQSSVSDELAFTLDESRDQSDAKPQPTVVGANDYDNLAEEEPESLLERLLDGDFADLDSPVEHEALNSLSLEDLAKSSQKQNNDEVEERIIEASLGELADSSDLIQQFEAGKTEGAQKKDKATAEKFSPNIDEQVAQDLEMLKSLTQSVSEEGSDDEVDIEEEGPLTGHQQLAENQTNILETLDSIDWADEHDFVELEDSTETDKSIDEKEKQSGSAVTLEDLKKNDAASDIKNRQNLAKNDTLDFLVPTPLPKSSFNSWLQQYKSPVLNSKLDDFKTGNDGDTKKKKGKKKEKETLIVAKASVQEDKEIATETLASLLEKQGHYGRAIRMYETLRLRNPEKSSFFAAKIETLQKLRDDE